MTIEESNGRPNFCIRILSQPSILPLLLNTRTVRSLARSKVGFETVRRIGLALPGVEDSASYGELALKANGKLLACKPSHRSAEPDRRAP